MQSKTNQPAQSEVIFSWSCQEYIKYQKNIWWYLISIIVLAVSIGWSVYTLNYLFAIFLGLFYVVVIMHEFINPLKTSCFITYDGIKQGNKFYFFKEIEHFFIIYQDQGIKNLYVDFKNPLKGRLVIDLDGQDAVSIREFLLNFLPEDLEREAEPLSERLRRWLRI